METTLMRLLTAPPASGNLAPSPPWRQAACPRVQAGHESWAPAGAGLPSAPWAAAWQAATEGGGDSFRRASSSAAWLKSTRSAL